LKDWLIEHKFHAVVIVLLILGGAYYVYANQNVEPVPLPSISEENNQQDEQKEMEKKEMEKKEETNQAQPSGTIMVDVKGQVKQPGVYQSNTDERVIDVIGRAGGLTEKADQTQVNFSAHVQDEMVIYIPAKGEEGSTLSASSGTITNSAGGTGKNQGKININKATEEELQNLPGIGPAKASAIIEFRNTSGPFKTVEDLKNVTGIGDKTYEKLKDMITV